jgi:hypothetical protein
MAKRKFPPVHPGVVLAEDFLKGLKISQYRLAKGIGVPPRGMEVAKDAIAGKARQRGRGPQGRLSAPLTQVFMSGCGASPDEKNGVRPCVCGLLLSFTRVYKAPGLKRRFAIVDQALDCAARNGRNSLT